MVAVLVAVGFQHVSLFRVVGDRAPTGTAGAGKDRPFSLIRSGSFCGVFRSHFENDCSQNESGSQHRVTLLYATRFSIEVNHKLVQDM